MDGTFGFRVQVQAKTLTTGQFRVKPSTIATVLGSHYVTAAAGGPVNLTLTDNSDSSEWQVQLTLDGVHHFVVSGLKPWLAHCSAQVGEAIAVFREADGSRLYVRLVRRAASATASAPSGPDTSQQQPASQRDSMPVSGCASEGIAAGVRPAEQDTRTTEGAIAPVPALHAAGSQAVPPSPATAVPPAEGVQGAQARPSMPELRRYCATASHGSDAPPRAFSSFTTGLASAEVSAPPDRDAGSSVAARYPSGLAQGPTANFAWHPGVLLASYAAVAVPQQPAPVRGYVRVPVGHGGCGGSGGPPPAAEPYGHHNVGAPFRPVDVNRQPCTVNQQGPPTGVAGAHGSTELGVGDGLRLRRDKLRPGHLLAATGIAAGTVGDELAAGSGACGSGAAAGTAVGDTHSTPVGGAGADLPGASPHAFTPDPAQANSPLGPLAEDVSYPQPDDGGGVAGAEGPSGGLRSRGAGGGTSGGRQPPAARRAAGAPAPGTCSGGGATEASGLAARVAWPVGADAGAAMRANRNQHKLRVRPPVAAALWPGLVKQLQYNQSQQVLLHTGCTPAAARQTGSGAQGQEGELRAFAVKLARYRAGFRLTGVMPAVRSLGVSVGDKEAVGLRRLPCGRVLLERWQQQGQKEDMQRAGAIDEELPLDEAKEGSDEEYVPSPKRRRLQERAPSGSSTEAGPLAQGQQGAQASALGPQQGTAIAATPVEPTAAAAGAQLSFKARYRRNVLHPPVAAVQAFWPELADGLRRSQGVANSVQVTLHTSMAAVRPEGTSEALPGQLGREHAVRLSSATTQSFRLSYAGGVLAALGLRGEGLLQLRRTPDGRVWAEHAPAPDVTQAVQQPAPGLAVASPTTTSHPGLGQVQVPGATAGTVGAVPTPSTTAPALQQPDLGGALASTAPVGAAHATDAAGPGAAGHMASILNTHPWPGRPHAAAAQAWDVHVTPASLLPTAAAARSLWPLEAAALEANLYPDNSAPVTLFAAACDRAPAATAESSARTQLVGGEQGPTEQHTVRLHYTAATKEFEVKEAARVIAALGLPGGDMLRLRWSPDGRTWAERALPPATNAAPQQPPLALAAFEDPTAAGTAAAAPTPSTTAPALQQPVPGLAAPSTGPTAAAPATDPVGIGDGSPVAAAASYSPCASPSRSTDTPHPVLGAPEASSTTTAGLCVSGGYLHPARPTVAALWPECLDMPVGTQQLVRMRAVMEPDGGSGTASAAASLNAHPKRSVTHYGTQLARLGGGAWRLERTHALLRELRLGDGDRVELVPLEGGVVGVQRAGAEMAGVAGWRVASGDRAGAAAAGEEAGGCGSTGGWTGGAGSCIGGVVDSGGIGVGDVPAASAHAAWLKGLMGAAYEEGWRREQQQQHGPQQEGQEDQQGQGQGDEGVQETNQERGDAEMQGLDQEPGKVQHQLHIQRQGQGEQQEEDQQGGLHWDCDMLPGANPLQHIPQQVGETQQQGLGQGGEEMQQDQGQGDEEMQGLDQAQKKEQQGVHIQRQGQGEQQEVHVQQQERSEDRLELEGEHGQQGQSQQQDERVLHKQEPSGEQGQGQGQGERGQGQEQRERGQGQEQCQVQRPQHQVGTVHANTCLQGQQCVGQRSALPVDPERALQAPRLDTGQAAMQRDEQRQAPEASVGSEVCRQQPSLPQQQVPYPRQGHQQHEQQLRQEQQYSSGTGTAGSSAAEKEWGMGTGCIRGHGQQQQQQQRPAVAHLPASSLTSAHLHGCLPPGLAPPPLQPGELRLCGLTFHPDLAPGVRRAMADWEAGLGGTPLHEVEPEAGQVRVLGAGKPGVGAWGDASDWSAALVQRYQLRPLVLTMELVRLLGLEEEEDWGRELPGEAPVRAGLERRRDGQRGGWGLWATAAVRKSHPIGVVGGHVMPAAAAKRFVDLGWRDCSEGVKAEVRQRVGGDGGRARVSYGWKMLAASYTIPYPVAEQSAQDVPRGLSSGGGRSSGGSAAPHVLSMLGYGTPTALANDPRVNPRAWQHGHDVDADQEQLHPNCGVVLVCLRGLVLPVLVALRDIAPGEQLLRDYGAAWWREVAGVWEVAEDQGLAAEALWHGAGSNA